MLIQPSTFSPAAAIQTQPSTRRRGSSGEKCSTDSANLLHIESASELKSTKDKTTEKSKVVSQATEPKKEKKKSEKAKNSPPLEKKANGTELKKSTVSNGAEIKKSPTAVYQQLLDQLARERLEQEAARTLENEAFDAVVRGCSLFLSPF